MFRKCCLILLVVTFFSFPTRSGAGDRAPWAFFDLGKTLIDHSSDYTEMRYLPGTLDYLRDLRRRGFHLGLLINWPEKEGTGNAEKLRLLKEYIKPRWVDEVPFDWKLFEAVLFPPKDIYRKPHPYLFIEALRTAAPGGVIYQGEDKEEYEVARRLGLAAHCVAGPSGTRVSLLAPDEILSLIRSTFIFVLPGTKD